MQARFNGEVRNDASFDTLGQRLRYARKLRGMTQTGLAESARVNQSDVSKLERGESHSTVNAVALARALRVSPVWLDTGDGPAPAEGPGTPATSPEELPDPLIPTPTIGITIVQLGAILAALSPMGAKMVAALVEEVLRDPSKAREAADTADAIARTQRLPVRNDRMARSFGSAQENPVETERAPLGD